MPVNWGLLNRADYENFDRVKEMLVMYNTHERNAYRGDTVAHSILVDLHTAIYSGVLTRKQLEAVEMYCIDNLTMDDIGKSLGIGKPRVFNRLHGAIRNIQKILVSGELFSVDREQNTP